MRDAPSGQDGGRGGAEGVVSRVLGAPVLLVAKPTDGKKSIVLGR